MFCNTILLFPVAALSTWLIFYLFSDCIGNGRGGESIYGGFFEGKEATVRAVSCYPNGHWLQDGSTILSFSPR